MNMFTNHRILFGTSFALFAFLTLVVAIMPAITNQKNNAPLPGTADLTADQLAGKQVFIANGCVACHTQQVRNVAMDKAWGERPGIAADYARITRTDFWRNTATLMGTERTGPDLSNVGIRQGSLAWNLVHLYQPRAVVSESIMPAYPWLFELKDQVAAGEIEVSIPSKFNPTNKKIVAKKEALQLVSYLQSLKQTELPEAPSFLYAEEEQEAKPGYSIQLPDGQQLYAKNCAPCHQTNGEGLPGAFPPLKGSSVVLGDDLELFVNIIMLGYDARPEYAVMNAVGLNNKLSAAEVTAIINHERNSWGNRAKPVDAEQVKNMMDFIKKTKTP
ncbi:MAG: c-type cytochrome [Bacteroidetes bacterium]|nr:MAG: c-type cytochrome [Bacteroidota bacterium]